MVMLLREIRALVKERPTVEEEAPRGHHGPVQGQRPVGHTGGL